MNFKRRTKRARDTTDVDGYLTGTGSSTLRGDGYMGPADPDSRFSLFSGNFCFFGKFIIIKSNGG